MSKYLFRLDEINISDIIPNPNNPRGADVRSNDDKFEYLKRSIETFGLIVPIIVREITGKEYKYMLLDGERRFLALKELGEKKVKANIIEGNPSEKETKNIMFHIHTNRLPWGAAQQCLALEPLYEDLKKRYGGNKNEIINELVRLTGTDKRTMVSRLKFYQWPKKCKTYVYASDPELYWTLVEIEDGIIEPAEKNFPEYFKKVSKNQVREFLLNKYIEKKVYASTNPRQVKCIMKVDRRDTEKHRYALKVFDKLVKDIDFSFEDAKEDFIARFPDVEEAPKTSYSKFANQIVKLISMLNDVSGSVMKLASEKQKNELADSLDELESAIEQFKKDNYGNSS